jgi:deazaflavin-dependent oxidoreductase (nitroreductase family)
MTSTNDWNDNNANVIKEFRNDGGKVTTRSGSSLLLLTTVGVKSRLQRTNPLAYLPGKRCIYVFGSKGGSPAHPDWYLNLVARPQVIVELGSERYEATAETITGIERGKIYARLVKLHPNFGDYEQKTARVIPVVALWNNAS